MCVYMYKYDIECDNKMMIFTAYGYVRIDAYISASSIKQRFTKTF